jgi:integrase
MSSSLTTDLAIRKWKAAKEGEARSVGGRDGLYVRGWASGAKAFYLRQGTWLKIGEYPEMRLTTAREIALVAKRLRKMGFGVEAIKKGLANSRDGSTFEKVVRGELLGGLATGKDRVPTYDELWLEWFADVEPTLQEGPSRRRPKAIHEQHVSPIIGSRPINEIRRREIYDMLLPLFRNIPVSAGHALGHVNKVFELAITKEFREENPTPPRSQFPKRSTPKEAHGTLPCGKMPELWTAVSASKASQQTKLAILTAMTTGHRVGVVVAAEWKHIDMETGVWTVPERTDKQEKGRMKSGRAYSLRLPSGLMDQLRALRRDNPAGPYVFESPTTTGHVSPNALLKVLKSIDPALTNHGFRNAIKEFCRKAEPPVPDHIADAFCDHSLKGLDASYRRMDTSNERAELAERLYAFVIDRTADSDFCPMPRELPLVENGHLVPNAAQVLLGYMFYPEDTQLAQDCAKTLTEDGTALSPHRPSQFAQSAVGKLPARHLYLVGEMALYVAENIRTEGQPLISRAAFVVSENQATNKRRDGKALPTSADAIRKNFTKHASVTHLWAAVVLQQETEEDNDIEEMLSLADMIKQMLNTHEDIEKYDLWSVPSFPGLRRYDWPDEGLIKNPDAVAKVLKGYRSRSGW